MLETDLTTKSTKDTKFKSGIQRFVGLDRNSGQDGSVRTADPWDRLGYKGPLCGPLAPRYCPWPKL